MKEKHRKAIIKYRIEQAEEALRDAEILIQSGGYRSAVNRSYYAMFYAVLALLAVEGKGTSKHAGVMTLFDREFVKAGIFGKDLSRWLHRAFDKRQELDYEEMIIPSSEDAKTILEQARDFVAQLKAYLDPRIKED